MLEKYLERLMNPTVDGVCYEGGLELCEDPINQMTVANFLKIIEGDPITYDNALPLRYRALLLERQINYVEDIVGTRDTENLGMSRKEVIQVISELGQAKSFFKHRITWNT